MLGCRQYYFKVGTMPMQDLRVLRKRKVPELGDLLLVKDVSQPGARPFEVRVLEVKDWIGDTKLLRGAQLREQTANRQPAYLLMPFDRYARSYLDGCSTCDSGV
jgi:hypothetical protein